MTALTQKQKDQFWRAGVLTVKSAVTPELLSALWAQFAERVEASRSHDSAYGETVHSRPRFAVEPSHSSQIPVLRHVNALADVSDVFLEALANMDSMTIRASLYQVRLPEFPKAASFFVQQSRPSMGSRT